MITPIPANFIGQVWPKVSHHVRSAIEYVESGFNEADILRLLDSRDMQLFVIGQYEGACVTQIVVYPQHKTCLIVALGGSGLNEWFDELMDTIEPWAKDQGCKFVEEFGRKGWARVGKARGYEQIYSVMRKSV